MCLFVMLRRESKVAEMESLSLCRSGDIRVRGIEQKLGRASCGRASKLFQPRYVSLVELNADLLMCREASNCFRICYEIQPGAKPHELLLSTTAVPGNTKIVVALDFHFYVRD